MTPHQKPAVTLGLVQPAEGPVYPAQHPDGDHPIRRRCGTCQWVRTAAGQSDDRRRVNAENVGDGAQIVGEREDVVALIRVTHHLVFAAEGLPVNRARTVVGESPLLPIPSPAAVATNIGGSPT